MNIRHLGGARPALALVLATCFPSMAWAQAAGSATPPSTPIFEAGADQGEQNVALHAQTTFVLQGHGRFHSPYQGANSLTPDPASRGGRFRKRNLKHVKADRVASPCFWQGVWPRWMGGH